MVNLDAGQDPFGWRPGLDHHVPAVGQGEPHDPGQVTGLEQHANRPRAQVHLTPVRQRGPVKPADDHHCSPFLARRLHQTTDMFSRENVFP